MKPWSRCHRKAQDGYGSVCSYRSFLPDSPQTTSPLLCTVTKNNSDKEEEERRRMVEDYLPVLCFVDCYNVVAKQKNVVLKVRSCCIFVFIYCVF